MITLLDGNFYRLTTNNFGEAILSKVEDDAGLTSSEYQHFHFKPCHDGWGDEMDKLTVKFQNEFIEIEVQHSTYDEFREMANKAMDFDLGPVVVTAIDPHDEDMAFGDDVSYRLFDFRYKNGVWSVTTREIQDCFGYSDWISPYGEPYHADEGGKLLLINKFNSNAQQVFWICGHTFEKLSALMQQTQSVVMATPSPEECAAQRAEAEEFAKAQLEKMS